jgi:hypothetical protein
MHESSPSSLDSIINIYIIVSIVVVVVVFTCSLVLPTTPAHGGSDSSTAPTGGGNDDDDDGDCDDDDNNNNKATAVLEDGLLLACFNLMAIYIVDILFGGMQPFIKLAQDVAQQYHQCAVGQ